MEQDRVEVPQTSLDYLQSVSDTLPLIMTPRDTYKDLSADDLQVIVGLENIPVDEAVIGYVRSERGYELAGPQSLLNILTFLYPVLVRSGPYQDEALYCIDSFTYPANVQQLIFRSRNTPLAYCSIMFDKQTGERFSNRSSFKINELFDFDQARDFIVRWNNGRE